jgi:hypothetical protein
MQSCHHSREYAGKQRHSICLLTWPSVSATVSSFSFAFIAATENGNFTMNGVVLLLALSPLLAPSPAEGTVRWATGYPLGIPNTGLALIQGRAKGSEGYQLVYVRVQYWEDGSTVHEKVAALRSDGTFGTVLSGLAPGASYNVMVRVVQSRDGEEQTLAGISRVKVR